MATHINTINALKGLTCAASSLIPLAALDGIRATALRAHVRKHLVAAGLEIDRLNSEAIKLRHENKRLQEKLNNETADLDDLKNSYEELWQSLLHAVAGTEAGRNIHSPTEQLTVIRAVDAIKKTEANRKEALRIAEAFQKVQPKTEPTEDIFAAVRRGIFNNYFPAPDVLNALTNQRAGLLIRGRYRFILTEIIDEAVRASAIHPQWPTDALHAVSILTEESGELMKAAIEYHYNNGDIEAVREEAIQTGAMALRVLLNIDRYKRPSDEK